MMMKIITLLACPSLKEMNIITAPNTVVASQPTTGNWDLGWHFLEIPSTPCPLLGVTTKDRKTT